MNKPQKVLLLALAGVSASFYASFLLLRWELISVYTFAFISSSLIFIPMCALILKNQLSQRIFYSLVIGGIILRMVLGFSHPVGSDDYYRYLWDGKVIASGINPYRYAPSDTALDSLHTSVLPSRINFAGMKTLYPPMAEMIFFAAYKLGGETQYGLKALEFVSELATITILFLVLGRMKLRKDNLLLYILAPLPFFQIMMDGHVDGFGVPFMLLSVYFFLSDRKGISFLFLAISICIKPLALILVPIYFLEEHGFRKRLLALIIPAAVCVVAYIPFVSTGSPFQALSTFAENWTFNGVVFDVLNGFVHDNQRTRLICGIVYVVPYVLILFSRKDFITKIYLSIFLLFIFSPVVHPWYLVWLAALLPLAPRWSGIVYISLISLTAITVMNYQLSGLWNEYPAVTIVEYVPVLSTFIYELFHSRGIAPAPVQ